MLTDKDIGQEHDPTQRYLEEIGKALSQSEGASSNGAKVEIVHKVTLGEQTKNQGLSYEIRTTLTSDLVDGQEHPTSVTQSMLAVDENDESEILLVNVDEDNSDNEYGLVLFVDFDALGNFDVEDIDEKDFEGYEVMIAVLKAAKNGEKAFTEQEVFWKKRFIAEIFKILEI